MMMMSLDLSPHSELSCDPVTSLLGSFVDDLAATPSGFFFLLFVARFSNFHGILVSFIMPFY